MKRIRSLIVKLKFSEHAVFAKCLKAERLKSLIGFAESFPCFACETTQLPSAYAFQHLLLETSSKFRFAGTRRTN